MRCLNCNAEIRNDVNFCPYCGHQIVRPDHREVINRRLRELEINIVQQKERLETQRKEYEAEMEKLDNEIIDTERKIEEIRRKIHDAETAGHSTTGENVEIHQKKTGRVYCPKCGAAVGTNDKFCGICGCNL